MNFVKTLKAKRSDQDKIPIEQVLDRIVTLNRGIRDFWSSADGWAPIEAAALLSKSRLDWQVSLSATLRLWFPSGGSQLTDGRLILAWANLGSLVEGTMKLFLSVFYADYSKDIDAFKKKNGKLIDPDVLTLERLRQFFTKKDLLSSEWESYVQHVQSRRNAIHAFEDKELGTGLEYEQAVRRYLKLVREINSRIPYPDHAFVPDEHGPL
jgi:hypothetical protein